MMRRIVSSVRKTAQAGFSMVELLMVMGLLSILLIVITNIFTTVLNVQLDAESHAAVSADGRYIMARLSYDLNRASSITTPATLGGTSTTTLAIVIGGVTNTYTLSGGTLQLTNGAGTDSLDGSDTTISSFNVRRLGVAAKDSVQVSFTVAGIPQPKQGVDSKTFTFTAGRR